MSFPGGKDGAGVAQRLINDIPPHDVFVSLFLGDCAVLRRKRPAPRNVAVDVDPEVLRRWITRPVMGVPLELYQCDAVEWLRHRCGWYLAADAGVPRSTLQRGWFLFADPPYVLASRRSPRALYAVEPDDAWHLNLVATLKHAATAAGAAVMVTHYPHTIYSEGLAGWRTWTYRAMTRGGRMATEQVWCSYPAPTRLHDSRYLGRDKREREKIHRRVRNAMAKLQRMTPLEVQAVMDAIVGTDSPLG